MSLLPCCICMQNQLVGHSIQVLVNSTAVGKESGGLKLCHHPATPPVGCCICMQNQPFGPSVQVQVIFEDVRYKPGQHKLCLPCYA